MYPAIALQSAGACVAANFGAQPFLYKELATPSLTQKTLTWARSLWLCVFEWFTVTFADMLAILYWTRACRLDFPYQDRLAVYLAATTCVSSRKLSLPKQPRSALTRHCKPLALNTEMLLHSIIREQQSRSAKRTLRMT